MENKVTSYETSKTLAEAGFDSEVHTGGYLRTTLDGGKTWTYFYTERDPEKQEWCLKAYDCHDLLMCLREKERDNGPSDFCAMRISLDKQHFYFNYLSCPRKIDWCAYDKQPQEALAKAIIEILKEDS